MNGAILVVEDEQAIADLVRAYLRREGFDGSGRAAASRRWRSSAATRCGWSCSTSACRASTASRSAGGCASRTGVPVLILSARDDEVDRVAGLEAGADDYVIKPFSPRELVARVKAILRRAGSAGALGAGVLAVGAVKLDRASRTVAVAGQPVELTSREFDLLAALLAHPGIVLSRDRLLELAWRGEFAGGTRTVDVHVAQLRAKLGLPGFVQTVRGAGYKVSV